MEQKILSAEPRRTFSNEFKLQMVKLASQLGASVARIAREHDINDNLLFGNDSNLLIVFYVQIMPDDFVMQLHRF
ncbi:transposase [Escherichia coli]|nr:transposase [Escherichia coli]